MLGKVALGGGGGAKDSTVLDSTFAGWLGTRGRLLYWPIAMRNGPFSFDSCYTWLTTTFERYGITDITMWTELTGHQRHELDHFDGVYIGGGNTYALLAECLASGFDRHLIDYATAGGAVYGGSAGAVILGTTLRTIAHLDQNTVGLEESRCLNLACDHAVWVHYTEQDDRRIADFIAEHHEPILALAEPAGASVVDGKLDSVGFAPALIFTEQGKQVLHHQ